MRKVPKLKAGKPAKYRPRGGVRKLFVDPDLDERLESTQKHIQQGTSYLTRKEVLIEGPAGTGKSMALMVWCTMMAKRYRNLRILWTRETRASMSETVLADYENDVLGIDHPMLQNGPQRENRPYYSFEDTNSLINLIGMNNPKRIMSGKYDIIVYFEVVDEQNESTWDDLLTRLRGQHIPFPRGGWTTKHGLLTEKAYKFKYRRRLPKHAKTVWHLRDEGWFEEGAPLADGLWPDGIPCFFHTQIGDCNPGHPMHWANKRADTKREDGSKKMLRIKSRHRDNPTVTKEYLDILRGLVGERRARLYEGKWVASEGMIYKKYSDELHHVPFDSKRKFDFYVGGLDFGFEDAGVFQLWGVNEEGMFRVLEVYRTKESRNWWVQLIADVASVYEIQTIVADPSNPETIESMNRKLGIQGAECRVEKAQNSIEDGIDAVIYGLMPAEGAKPLIYFCQGDRVFPVGFDAQLLEKKHPVRTEEEIVSYVWDTWKPGKSYKEQPKGGQPDHGLDVLRYVAMYVFGNDRLPEVVSAQKEQERWSERLCSKLLTEANERRGIREQAPRYF